MTSINFKAEPTCADFMNSQAFFRLIAGPVGSAKTTTCIMELLTRSIEQEQAPDGLRHSRFAIVRQTLKQLKDTVLKDITGWLDGIVSYKVSDNTVYVSFGEVRSEWLLIPLDDPEDQRRLLSMQLTGAWLSECIEMSTEIIAPLMGRVGRYPKDGCTWFGLIADTNMPAEGDPWHNLMEINTPANWQVFIQPGGREANAENLNWLTQTKKTLQLPLDHPDRVAQGRSYYTRLAESHSPDWVKRYVDAQYGNDPTGMAVFKESFKKGFHTVKLRAEDRENGEKYALTPSFGFPLIIAQDFGRNPCSLICQMDHKGRGLVLQELVAQDIGLEMHIVQALKPMLQTERYVGRPVYVIGDPAGTAKNTTFEETSFDTLKRHGFNAYPAPTNQIGKRLAGVETMLLQQRDGGPALIIDEDNCPMLTLAMNGRYRYAKRKNGQLAPLPEKFHPWSDLADDLQYFCVTVNGGMGGYVAQRLNNAIPRVGATGPRQRISARGWT